jgi:phospholipid N-methyltransferase
MSKAKFFKNFLKKPSEVGAILPSSRRLAEMMVSDIGLQNAEAVVELGPGTGVFTDVILEKINRNTLFFTIERNEDIYNHFTENYPDVKCYNRCASEILDIMKIEKVEKLDAVISGLPWASFPSEAQHSILNAVVEALKDGGSFVTFAYLQGFLLPAAHRFKKLLKSKFSDVQLSKVVWRNAPPAFVYRCRK